MSYHKNIIPFLGFNNNSGKYEFIGSCFIIKDNILITAGHNIGKKCNQEYIFYAILFLNEYINLGSPIYYEYSEEFINSGDYKDLAIFKLDVVVNDSFEISNNDLEKEDKLNVFDVPDPESSSNISEKNKSEVTIYIPDRSFRNYPKQGRSRLTQYDNCFNLKERLKPGYSGGPVFINEVVYGMIVYGPNENEEIVNKYKDFGASAIKSSYIFKLLSSIVK